MKFEQSLIEGRLIKRYKRFLADVELADNTTLTVYCPNTGSMKGCAVPGSKVWLSKTNNIKRKYQYALELIEVDNAMIGINTALPNSLVVEALNNNVISELADFSKLSQEVKYGQENSRIDILLEYEDLFCYVEVKNVTLVENRVAYFPDAITTRGQKHLRELINMVKTGSRAVIFYCVSHTDAVEVRPADSIDAEYGRLLRQAIEHGVEALAYRVDIDQAQMLISSRVPVIID